MNRGWALSVVLNIAGILALLSPVVAQTVREDNTLGGENSRVTRNVQIRGRDSDRIEGGARRGQNLFHSFEQFDVQEGRGAYFLNPDGVQNIFSRVTGNTVSNINGTLGVIQADNQTLGTANLFFMNPNGILFGAGSSLDLGGSFVGTTANAIGFGDRGFFNASGSEVPSNLLTINPSAFLFSQAPVGNIVNTSVAPAGTSPLGRNLFGLKVLDGRSLLLLGGDIALSGGSLNAQGGRIELGGLAEIGAVTIDVEDSTLSLIFPSNHALSNVTLTNDSRVGVRGTVGGDIVVHSNIFSATNGGRLVGGVEGTGNGGNITVDSAQFNISGTNPSGGVSGIFQQIVPGIPNSGNTGNITINADSFTASLGAEVQNIILSGATGNAGNISVKARDISLASDSFVRSETFGQGRGGDIHLTGDQLIAQSGGQISAGSGRENISGNFGAGGHVVINFTGLVELDGQGGIQNRSGIFSETASASRAGDIDLTARQLIVRNGAAVSSSSVGSGSLGGDGGTITINTTDSTEVIGSGTRSSIITTEANPMSGTERVSNAGNLIIYTGQLTLRDGAAIQSLATVEPSADENAAVEGRANAGRIIIRANDSILIENSSISSEVQSNAIGNAGDITIEADSLSLSSLAGSTDSRSDISTTTSGQGNSGQITLQIDGATSLSGQSYIFSQVLNRGRGNAGNIDITARSLSLMDGAEIAASMFRAEDGLPGGQGERAGDVRVNATEFINIEGVGLTGFSSGIFANTQRGASGRGGNLDITTGQFRVANGGVVTAQTLNSSDSGNITINADSLEATGGGQVVANTLSGGNARNIRLNIAGNIVLSGFDPNYDNRLPQFPNAPVVNTSPSSGIFATAEPDSTGNAGDITLQANSIFLADRAQISAATSGTGSSGNINVRKTGAISLDNASISTAINAGAVLANPTNRGNISLQADRFSLTNNSGITASTSGRGNAGNITVQDANRVNLDRSTISSTVNIGAIGEGGSIGINTDSLNLDRANITASTQGQGRAGDVTVRGADRVSLNHSTISTEVGIPGIGQGGSIDIQTRSINLGSRSNITASTNGQGSTGSIAVNATDRTSLTNNSGITSEVRQGATGNSRNITLQTPRLTLRGDSTISAATDGNGSAGNIVIDSDNILLSNSDISTEVESNAIIPQSPTTRAPSTRDRQGNIDIDTRSLSLNNAQITASTNGQGAAGDVNLNARQTVSLEDNSSISSAVRQNGRGRGGNVTLAADSLTIDRSRVNASTAGRGRAGNVRINANTLEATNGGRLITSSSSDRPAGSIILRDLHSVTLDGRNSGIFANTTPRSSGEGGSINLTTRNLNLNNNAAISAASQGTGEAGSIRIQATETLNTNTGNITTSATQSAGGAINLIGGDINLSGSSNIQTNVDNGSEDSGTITVTADDVRLRDNSDIQTDVRSGTGDGDGGDIAIAADSIVAYDDSDIISSAPNRGGDINLNTPAFFGLSITHKCVEVLQRVDLRHQV